MSPAEKLALVATAIGLLSVLGGWLRWGRPRLSKLKREVIAMRDAILGREPTVDSITGRELAPALPGMGVRQARTEEQMALLTEAVAKIADSHVRLEHIEHRVDRHEEEIATLKASSVERVVSKAESAAAWRAVEAVAQSTPPDETEE